MQEQRLFEYAVIRVVPRVEREEFLNVGVILYCAKPAFLKMVFHLDAERFAAFAPELDIAALRENLDAFERIASGDKTSGPISKLDAPSRFRWLTATRSTVLQVSKVHPGFCTDGEAMLQKLYTELVL